jgi:hypothetical protein
MSFDLGDVPAFLEAIAEKIGPSLPTPTVRDIVDTIEGMDVEEELSWALEVDFEGRSVPLQIVAFMDDSDAPDLLLFTVPDLARRLEPVFEARMK